MDEFLGELRAEILEGYFVEDVVRLTMRVSWTLRVLACSWAARISATVADSCLRAWCQPHKMPVGVFSQDFAPGCLFYRLRLSRVRILNGCQRISI